MATSKERRAKRISDYEDMVVESGGEQGGADVDTGIGRRTKKRGEGKQKPAAAKGSTTRPKAAPTSRTTRADRMAGTAAAKAEAAAKPKAKSSKMATSKKPPKKDSGPMGYTGAKVRTRAQIEADSKKKPRGGER